MKFLKIFFILLLFLLIGIGIFLWTFDLNTYRGYIERKVSTALGTPVRIGSLSMKLSLIPTIEVQNIQMELSRSIKINSIKFIKMELDSISMVKITTKTEISNQH